MSIRKILVPLSGQYDPADPESLETPALETAFNVGRRLGAHVEVFCIEADLPSAQSRLSPWIPGFSMGTLIDMIDKESVKRRGRVRELFEVVADRCSAPRSSKPDSTAAFSVNFLEQVGQVGGSMSVRGRLADLIVTACFSLDQAFFAGDAPPLLEVALRNTGKPLLISPSKARETFGQKIAIAWNGTSEAARAVSLAIEFLKTAEEVIVISVNEGKAIEPDGDSLADYLQWHGVRSRTVTLDGSAASSGQILLEQIDESGADMLVMGAYTQDRFRRVVFGGVTGKVLAEMPVPVLMVD
tara:strand:- start:96128 stop:97024 length:897 start_codon:yes stop_codon:yes gene_type:complete